MSRSHNEYFHYGRIISSFNIVLGSYIKVGSDWELVSVI